ncbi:hypothetical protein HYH03_001547 [Edaphochlamys debaryana]|uniref:Ankyrin repeat domain-containing protein n=1 Tax=Edaphochlamys debaryana TaxID=47281 RepID=A0A836C5D3_9CHLO|nr:hypothetical protein HYH03_001547 [Edaphochlamys debaryana]|eukprot:KAG2500785.1 hypothetical protein HYH03_001547 [Edaphochlamys debaryana]
MDHLLEVWDQAQAAAAAVVEAAAAAPTAQAAEAVHAPSGAAGVGVAGTHAPGSDSLEYGHDSGSDMGAWDSDNDSNSEWEHNLPEDAKGPRLVLAALQGCDLATVQRMCARPDGPGDPASWTPAHRKFALRAAFHSPTPDWRAKCDWLIERGARWSRGTSATSELRFSGVYRPPRGAEYIVRLQMLRSHGRILSRDTVQLACAENDVEVLLWLLVGGVRPEDDDVANIVTFAVGEGKLEALLALEQAAPRTLRHLLWDDITFTAAMGGHVSTLAWALDKRWGKRPRTAAALRKDGFGAAIFAAAAYSGSVAAIQWLHERGYSTCGTDGLLGAEAKMCLGHLLPECPLEVAAWPAAVASGCEAAVELLAELGCAQPANGEPYSAAIRSRDWRMLPLLRRLGVPLGAPGDRRLVVHALSTGAPRSLLQWLSRE